MPAGVLALAVVVVLGVTGRSDVQSPSDALFELIPTDLYSKSQEAVVRCLVSEIVGDGVFCQEEDCRIPDMDPVPEVTLDWLAGNEDSELAERISIPGRLITWLLQNPPAGELLPDAGFQISGALIEGDLIQLVPRTVLPVYLENCVFRTRNGGRTNVQGHFAKLSLSASTFAEGLLISGTVVDGSLDLGRVTCAIDSDSESCRDVPGFEIRDASIGGDLVLSGLLVRVQTESNCYCTCIAKLSNSYVSGNLLLLTGLLVNPEGSALICDGLHVRGDFLLGSFGPMPAGGDEEKEDPPTPADGAEKKDPPTQAGGNEEKDPCSVSSDAVRFERFTAQGELAVRDSAIDGSLVLVGGCFCCAAKDALQIENTPIGRSLTLDSLRVNGEVSIVDASVDSDVSLRKSVFCNPLCSRPNTACHCSELREGKFGIEGRPGVDLTGASVGGSVRIEDCFFECRDLSLDQARVVDSVRLEGSDGWRSCVSMEGAVVGSSVTVESCNLLNTGGQAARLRRTEIGGDLTFAQTVKIDGDVLLAAVQVRGAFNPECVEWAPGSSLDLSNAVLGRLDGVPGLSREAYEKKRRRNPSDVGRDPWRNWPNAGHLTLTGCRYSSVSIDGDRRQVRDALFEFLALTHLQEPTQLKSEVLAAETYQAKKPEAAEEDADTDEGVSENGDGQSDSGETGGGAPAPNQGVDPPAFPHQPYHQLAEVLENRGHEGLARDIRMRRFIDYRHYAAKHRGVSGIVESVGSVLFQAIAGFGYVPRRVIWWMAGTILLCSAVLFCANRRDLVVPADEAKKGSYRRQFNALMYSIDVFVPIIDFRQAKHWVPGEKLRPEDKPPHDKSKKGKLKEANMRRDRAIRALRAWLWLCTALGWLFTTLLVASLTGLLKT